MLEAAPPVERVGRYPTDILNRKPYIPTPLELMENKLRSKWNDKAQQLDTIRRMHYTRRRIDRIDANITSLKSVSPQHKVRMQEIQDTQREEETKSILTRFAAFLGIKNPLDQQNEGTVDASSAGYC